MSLFKNRLDEIEELVNQETTQSLGKALTLAKEIAIDNAKYKDDLSQLEAYLRVINDALFFRLEYLLNNLIRTNKTRNPSGYQRGIENVKNSILKTRKHIFEIKKLMKKLTKDIVLLER